MVLTRSVHQGALLPPGTNDPTFLALVELSQHWFTSLTKGHHHIDVIFVLCMVVYVVISLLWTTYWILARRLNLVTGTGRVYTLLVAITWGLTSVCMHVLNKCVVERTKAPSLIASVQMGLAVLVLAPVSAHELFQASSGQLRRWLLVPVLFGSAVCMASYTYVYISLSLYTIVRNLAPIVVMPLEWILMERAKQPKITPMVCFALITMVFGAVLYMGGLYGVSWIGILCAVINMILALGDRLLERRLLTTECKDLPNRVCTLVNNVMGIFPCLLVARFTHEIRDVTRVHADAWTHPHNILLIIFSGIAGLGICYLGIECQRLFSVTSFYVMQNVSRVFLVMVGVVLFNEPLRATQSCLGLFLSLAGSCLYACIQLHATPFVDSKPVKSSAM